MKRTESDGTPEERCIQIAVVTPSLAPYRIALLNRISQIPNVSVTALVASRTWHFQNRPVQYGDARFAYQVFRTISIYFYTKRADLAALCLSPGLWTHLSQIRYDMVLTLGWTTPNTWLALLDSKLRGRPVLLWETSIPHPASKLKQWLMPVLRRYFGAFDGMLATSTATMRYLVSMGARADRVTLIPQTIDNEAFGKQVEQKRLERDELKQGIGLDSRRVILFVGQLTERKGLRPLFTAFRSIAEKYPDVSLLLVGAGPLQSELEEQRAADGLQDRIILHGYVAGPELPAYYALADIFVLPSLYDTFGVVVDEAMAAGLPIITTDQVGAAVDLVKPGINGLVVRAGDAAELSNALTALLNDETLCRTMGLESRRIISEWNLDLAAQNFSKILHLLLNDSPARDAVPEMRELV